MRIELAVALGIALAPVSVAATGTDAFSAFKQVRKLLVENDCASFVDILVEIDEPPSDAVRRFDTIAKDFEARPQLARSLYPCGDAKATPAAAMGERAKSAIAAPATPRESTPPAVAFARVAATPDAAAGLDAAPTSDNSSDEGGSQESASGDNKKEATDDPSAWSRLHIGLGLVYLNPFSLERVNTVPPTIPREFSFSEEDTKLRPFFEIGWKRRAAWDALNEGAGEESCFGLAAVSADCSKAKAVTRIDFEARAGVILNPDDKASGSSLSGSGEGWIEAALGFPLVSWGDRRSRMSANLEVFGSIVADAGAEDLHSTLLLGPSIVFSSRLWKRPVEGLLRVGGVWTDLPRIIPNRFDAEGDALVSSENGFPHFKNEWGAVGTQFQIQIPLKPPAEDSKTTGLAFFLRGNYYAGFDPNPWTVQFGLTSDGSFLTGLIPPALTNLLGGTGNGDGKEGEEGAQDIPDSKEAEGTENTPDEADETDA
ncbi:MAG: hypothetical protein FJ091_01140 [Deltaproteobacteria bacterium]|nr:hypothetical protein [Deltaproteobacteria bacterium]